MIEIHTEEAPDGTVSYYGTGTLESETQFKTSPSSSRDEAILDAIRYRLCSQSQQVLVLMAMLPGFGSRDDVVDVEWYPNRGKLKTPGVKGDDLYFPVLDGRRLNLVAESPEMAYLLGLGFKYEGPNSKFAKYAGRILDIDDAWTAS